MLRQMYPLVGSGCPPELTEAALLEHATVAWLEDAQRRLISCARCPSEGAACESALGLFKPGQLAVWQGDRIVAGRCDRWVEYVVRTRAGYAGVPDLYRRCTFAGFVPKTDAEESAASAVLGFHSRVTSGQAAWLVLSGPPRSGKTHLAAALIRNLVRGRSRLKCRYADMLSLRVALKNWKFDSDDPGPLDPLLRADVLVLDNFDTERLHREAEWLFERIEDLIRARWVEQKSTLLTTHGDPASIALAFATITTLSEAPTCQLA